jgi:hypothetical protein
VAGIQRSSVASLATAQSMAADIGGKGSMIKQEDRATGAVSGKTYTVTMIRQ